MRWLPWATVLAACAGPSGSDRDACPAEHCAVDAPSHDAAIDLFDHADSLDAAPADASVDTSAADVPDPHDRSRCVAMPDARGVTQRLVVGPSGAMMHYVGYAPASYDPATLQSLVVALHGAGDTAANYFGIIWRANADAAGFLVLTPEASCAVGSGFTWCNDDPNSILAAIDDFAACYTVDPRRRILNGFSAGGVLTYAIGLQASPVFAGMAISSADLGTAEAISGMTLLPSAWPIPLSQFHGINDMNFPIAYARAGRDRLIAGGHTVYWHEFDGGHTTTPAFAMQMYADLMSARSPPGGP